MQVFQYEHARPSVTVDCVVAGVDLSEEDLKVLLVQRGEEPYRGWWALPGGFVRMDETLEQAAARELDEESGLRDVYLEQLYTFGQPDRDPRDRVISVAYMALVNMEGRLPEATTDAVDAGWFSLDELPRLAFDHSTIIDMALERLRGKVTYQAVAFEFLPAKFTLTQLQRVIEIIVGSRMDKRNFRKKILSLGVLEPLDEIEKDVARRAARLYRFNRDRYNERLTQGLEFQI